MNGGMEQYTGLNDLWALQEEIRMLKMAQYEQGQQLSQHSDRLGRLERRHDDSRIRSLWSTPSPFPAPLSSFTQRMHTFVVTSLVILFSSD